MASFDPKRTQVAGRATNFAVLFNATFRGGMPGAPDLAVDLTTPPGPSTAGGKQVRQHIRLVPRDGGTAIVVGFVNGIDALAELRTYGHLAEVHSRRFKGASLPFDELSYKDLVKRLQGFFGSQGFTVVMVDVSSSLPPPSGARTGPAPAASSAGWWVALLLLLALLGLGLWWARGRGVLGRSHAAKAPQPMTAMSWAATRVAG